VTKTYLIAIFWRLALLQQAFPVGLKAFLLFKSTEMLGYAFKFLVFNFSQAGLKHFNFSDQYVDVFSSKLVCIFNSADDFLELFVVFSELLGFFVFHYQLVNLFFNLCHVLGLQLAIGVNLKFMLQTSAELVKVVLVFSRF